MSSGKLRQAVGLDFGATSMRFALASLVDDRIQVEIIEQEPHHTKNVGDHIVWDFEHLLKFAHRAFAYAQEKDATFGIDSWAVDFGFQSKGQLVQPVVAYRDESHLRAFEALAPHRRRLYELTGCQHQPFNTLYQLYARRTEDATLTTHSWLMIPDLIRTHLGGSPFTEYTNASSSNFMGLDGTWSAEAFDLIGWPVPSLPIQRGGSESVNGGLICNVGSHDTASAVFGLGTLDNQTMFLNIGTWCLLGTVIDQPIVTVEAESALLANERTVDGRVRLLKNVPGFYVLNRLHQELKVSMDVGSWLESAAHSDQWIDLTASEFLNPDSMVELFNEKLGRTPVSQEEWAGVALQSLVQTLKNQISVLELVTGRHLTSIKVGGGGANSRILCQHFADISGRIVTKGASECTVLGNVSSQLMLSHNLRFDEITRMIDRSSEGEIYYPKESQRNL